MDTQLSLIRAFIARWKAKQPKLFKVITNLSVILSILSGLPLIIEYFLPGVTLPVVVSDVIAKIVFVASTAVGFITKLTVDTPMATESALQKLDAGAKPEVVQKSV